MKITRTLALAVAAGSLAGAAAGTWAGAALAQDSGPVYSQGTIVELCIGIGGAVQDHVYAEAGKDAGIQGSCAANYEQLPVPADPDGYAIGQAVSSAADVVTVTNPGNQASNEDAAISLALGASSSQAHPITSWSATGLPGTLAINSSGVISGSAGATAGTFVVTVTATDSVDTVGTVTFDWVINP